MPSWLHDLYAVAWLATWGNNVAAVEWALAGSAAAFLGRHRIRRAVKDLRALWARHHPLNDDLREIRQVAEAARRIAADTHERLTGERHPDSPEATPPGRGEP